MFNLIIASSKCAEQHEINHEFPCLGRGYAHWLLAAHSEKKRRLVCFCSSTVLSTYLCLSSVRWSTYFIHAFSNTCTQMHANISLNVRGEHPRLQWVTPGYANSLSPLLLYSPVPTPAASGTYWRQSHTEP